MFTFLLILIFFASFAMLFREGLWTNAVTLINVVTAGLIATSMFETVADWLDGLLPSYTYLWDFIALWTLFCVCMIVFRAITDALSKIQVRFRQPVEITGGVVMAIWVSWVVVCFTTMTFHTAPLARNFLFGSFQPAPDSRMFLGLAPDRQWLSFVQTVSKGSFSTRPPEGVDENADGDAYVFDPGGEFILRYGQRRANFERLGTVRVRR